MGKAVLRLFHSTSVFYISYSVTQRADSDSGGFWLVCQACPGRPQPVSPVNACPTSLFSPFPNQSVSWRYRNGLPVGCQRVVVSALQLSTGVSQCNGTSNATPAFLLSSCLYRSSFLRKSWAQSTAKLPTPNRIPVHCSQERYFKSTAVPTAWECMPCNEMGDWRCPDDVVQYPYLDNTTGSLLSQDVDNCSSPRSYPFLGLVPGLADREQVVCSFMSGNGKR